MVLKYFNGLYFQAENRNVEQIIGSTFKVGEIGAQYIELSVNDLALDHTVRQQWRVIKLNPLTMLKIRTL